MHRLISAAAGDGPLAWVVLEATDRGDPIAQGIKLSDGLAVAVGSRLFPRATPVNAGLGLLRRYLDALRPITLALSGVGNGVELAAGLIALRAPDCRVLLSDDAISLSALTELAGCSGALVLDEEALRLTMVEAKVETAGHVSDADLRRHLDETGHAYESLLVRLGTSYGDAISSDPTAGGPDVTPDLEIDILLEAGEWREAAELAVRKASARAPMVLRDVAPMFHEHGLHRALWRLLEQISSEVIRDDEILYWELTAAVRLGKQHEVRDVVEARLASREAPDLRALHAGVFLDVGDARLEVERAYRARQTAFTAYQYGRVLANAREGARILKGAVRLAEGSGREYDVTRNASALTARLIDSGEYSQAASWGEWALARFDRLELSNTQQRLYILNNWAYARLLTGESVGLEGLLREAEQELAGAFPGLRAQFRSTLGDFLLAMDRADESLEYYQTNYEEAPRKMKGIRALNLVRALLEQAPEEVKYARAIANEAYALSSIDGWDYHRSAVLALGMVLAVCDPYSAEEHLTQVLRKEHVALPVPQHVQATLYLACSKLALGESEQARSLVEGCPNGLKFLTATGLRLLAGPPARFRELWSWCSGNSPTLELRFMGRREVLVRGETVSLGLQACTLLALLSQFPRGLTATQLLSHLKYESRNSAALYAALSKLRQLVPISAPPYRLEVDVTADFIEAPKLLRDGRLRSALELYRGPLLEESDAPGIVDLRSFIDESFRQATLVVHDPEASMALAQRVGDDLELWEHALDSLNSNDPRALLARARVAQLRREY
ncbi:MAG: hypothetical protein WD314_03150 [Trueperaceae bacterium]